MSSWEICRVGKHPWAGRPANTRSPKLRPLRLLVGLALMLTVQLACGQESSFDAAEHFKKMDRNGNRYLESNELNEKSKRYLSRLGHDTSNGIRLRHVLHSIEKRDEREKTSSQKSSQKLLVPSFGDTEDQSPETPSGFGKQTDQKPIEYSEASRKLADMTMRRHDRNRDNFIDSREMRRARLGNPDPSESDTDQDGKLSSDELLKRFHLQEQSRNNTQGKQPKEAKDKEAKDKKPPANSDRGNRPNRRRPPNSAPASRSRKSSGVSSRQDERIRNLNYSKSLIDKYDKDNDRRLNKEEWKSVKRPPKNADKNGDGFVSEQEYADALKGQQSPSGNSASSRSKRSRPSSGSAASSTGPLNKLDADGDAQVQMHEYASDWDAAKLDEFYKLDQNHDGVITSQEWQQQ